MNPIIHLQNNALNLRIEPNINRVSYFKSSLTITAIALSIIGSFCVTYAFPAYVTYTSLAFYASFLSVPAMLKMNNIDYMKVALVVSFVAMGGIALGFVSSVSLSLAQGLLTKSIGISLSYGFIGAATCLALLIGKCVMPCFKLLKTAFEIACGKENSEWTARLTTIRTVINRYTPSIGDAKTAFYIIKAFCSPQKIDFETNQLATDIATRVLLFRPESYESILSLTNRYQINLGIQALQQTGITPEKIREFIAQRAPHQYRAALLTIPKIEDYTIPPFMLKAVGERLITMMRSCYVFSRNLDIFNKAFDAFISTPELLNFWATSLSNLEFFLPTLEQKIAVFMRNLSRIQTELKPRYHQLSDEMRRLEQEWPLVRPEGRGAFIQRFKNLSEQFATLKDEVEAIHRQKILFDPVIQRLRVDNFQTVLPNITEALELNRFNPLALYHLDALHELILGRNEFADPLITHIKELSQQLNLLNETTAETFLNERPFQFSVGDYQSLRKALNISTQHSLGNKLREIGFVTANDYYAANIIPREGLVVKEAITSNLLAYAEEKIAAQRNWKKRFSIYLPTTLKALSEKVAMVIYRAITAGLIFIPMVINPMGAAGGYVFGTTYFLLKRLNWSRTRPLFAAIERFSTPSSFFLDPRHILNNLTSRSLIFSTPQSTAQSKAFVKGNLFTKVGILGTELGKTFLLGLHSAGVGGFLQGATVAREMVLQM